MSWTRGNHTFKFGEATYKRDDSTDLDPGINYQFPLASEFGPESLQPTLIRRRCSWTPGDLFGAGNLLTATQAFPQRPVSPDRPIATSAYTRRTSGKSPYLPVLTAGIRLNTTQTPYARSTASDGSPPATPMSPLTRRRPTIP